MYTNQSALGPRGGTDHSVTPTQNDTCLSILGHIVKRSVERYGWCIRWSDHEVKCEVSRISRYGPSDRPTTYPFMMKMKALKASIKKGSNTLFFQINELTITPVLERRL